MNACHDGLIRFCMVKKVVVANRGEIAVRIIRSCREMGICSVALFSDADRMARHVMLADEAYAIGPAPSKESYLDIDKVMEVVLACGADAVHPGYGFLSENAELARRCAAAGVVFIGPRAETIERMGDKIAARRSMIEAGVPVVPGIERMLESVSEAAGVCRQIGFPVIIKASSGGGARGCAWCVPRRRLLRLMRLPVPRHSHRSVTKLCI